MDKKNIIIGLLMISAAFGINLWQAKTKAEQPVLVQSSPERPATINTDAVPTGEVVLTPITPFKPIAQPNKTLTSSPEVSETITYLENDFVKVAFSDKGGAIQSVALKKYPESLNAEDPFIFNRGATTAALSISFEQTDGAIQVYAPHYQLVEQTQSKLSYQHITPEGIYIRRSFTLANTTDTDTEPYLINHTIQFENPTEQTFDLRELYVTLGSLPATPADPVGEYLNFGYYNSKSAEFVRLNKLLPSKGFLGMGASKGMPFMTQSASPIIWASIKNQFFTSVLTPSISGTGIWVKPVALPLVASAGVAVESQGITGGLKLNLDPIEPQKSQSIDMDYYVGPKEYLRLDHMGQNQDLVMQFGFFGFISKLLLAFMIGIHKFIPNWGLTIIILTVIIKLLLWPLTAAQVRSSKRMAKLQEPLQALKLKLKDNPQKLQVETMKLFKEHGVNPAAGCLPLFVQLPIFLGLYFMLRTCSELRFANFLWIKDLSVADTIATIAGFPVNILPFIMGITMYFQMKVMPSPTTDPIQRKIFQIMPFTFLFICYNFPAGLVLYWTIQNILTIVQQSITSRMKDPHVLLNTQGSVLKNSKKPKAIKS